MKKVLAACWLVLITALAITGFGFICGADLCYYRERLADSAVCGGFCFVCLLVLAALVWATLQAAKALSE